MNSEHKHLHSKTSVYSRKYYCLIYLTDLGILHGILDDLLHDGLHGLHSLLPPSHIAV